MPQLGTYGSVRGVPGNRHPYRDRRKDLAVMPKAIPTIPWVVRENNWSARVTG